MGSLLFMALIGLLIATLVNLFWANATLYWITTCAGVLIFVGLTAYDTEALKTIAARTADNPSPGPARATVLTPSPNSRSTRTPRYARSRRVRGGARHRSITAMDGIRDGNAGERRLSRSTSWRRIAAACGDC